MPKIKISLWLPVFLCLIYHFGMGQWVFSFLIAAVIHELGHIACIYYLGARVTALRLSVGGAVIESTPLSYRQEALCAFAGPFAGFLTALLSIRIFPAIGFFALAQSLYNILPVFPLDGGRSLKAILSMRLPLHKAEQLLNLIHIGTLLAILLLSMCYLRPRLSGVWFLFPVVTLVLQTAPIPWRKG